MGYRRKTVVHTLDLGEKYPGFEVTMKGLKVGEMRRLLRALGDDAETEEMIGEVTGILSTHTLSWNLEDEEGRPVQPTTEAFEDFDLDMLMDVVNAWLDKVNGTDIADTDLGKGSQSGEQFPGRPVTMELL